MMWRRFIFLFVIYDALSVVLAYALAIYGALYDAFAITNAMTFLVGPLLLFAFSYRFYQNTKLSIGNRTCLGYGMLWFGLKLLTDLMLLRILYALPASYLATPSVLVFYAVLLVAFYLGFRTARPRSRSARTEGLAV